jgi:carbamoyl-phosphate synthase large subunit
MLLSAGSLLAHKLIEALGPRRAHCVLIGTNSIAEASGNFRCDVAYLVPPAAAGADYIDRIDKIIREEAPDLVIPCRDDDVLALAVLRERGLSGAAVLLAGSVAAARIMNDKLETARFAACHGLPFAPTASNPSEALALAGAHGLPLIGKPRWGFASRGIVLLRSPAEIERAFAQSPDLIAQPYLDPPPNMNALVAPFEAGLPFVFSFPESGVHTLQVIVGPDGQASKSFAALARQVGGVAVELHRCDDPQLVETGDAYGRAAAAEGWIGPLNVQLKRTPDGRFVAYELNGRFTGTAAEHLHMGRDALHRVVSRFLPEVDFPAIDVCDADVVQRHLCSYPVLREGAAALRTQGRWSASQSPSRAD